LQERFQGILQGFYRPVLGLAGTAIADRGVIRGSVREKTAREGFSRGLLHARNSVWGVAATLGFGLKGRVGGPEWPSEDAFWHLGFIFATAE
jgi:hypothetical protein